MYYNLDMGTLTKTTLIIAKALLKEAGATGISKVRLAKMIYFTHKELCRKGLLNVGDIQYIPDFCKKSPFQNAMLEYRD